MSDDYREWLKDYLKKHLGEWTRELDKQFMDSPTIKNWPIKIEVELPCECCGELQKVPFMAKRFRAKKDNVEWPYYIEYMSPALLFSTCPSCERPFRLNRKMPEQRM